MNLMTYKKPLQSRAILTEQRFLDALHELLQEKSLGQLTVDDIAEKAQLTRGAFLKRFGTKNAAGRSPKLKSSQVEGNRRRGGKVRRGRVRGGKTKICKK